MIEKRISERIKLTVILATILVVVRHSFNAHIYRSDIWQIGPQDISTFIQLLNVHITAIAVPTFFLLSGYLFFYNFQTKKDLLRKWHSRLHSLIIPYLLWNVIYFLFFLVIIPNTTFLSNFAAFDPPKFNIQTVLIKLTIHPAAGQLWYVRDLIGFVVLTPLFYFVYLHKWVAGLTLLCLLLYWHPVDLSVLSSEGLFFFFIGGWAGHRQFDLNRLQTDSLWGDGMILALWLFICVCQTLWPTEGLIEELVTKVSTLAGLVVFWLLTSRINNPLARDRLLYLAPYAFFIYIMHSPLVRYVYKVLLSLAPQSMHYNLLVYIATPVITISICFCMAKIIQYSNIRFYSLLTGGR